ncbi:hypothetical protein ANN_09547 [Periplaneta americana]|uniref:Uncharacterized protein n=1 Tax=Periplaneta americana TaxID=6978 RepID=A0ABQ8TQ79_PERAM|nr:hypothetical protein ANN_09547 [Periplaneta americana]
MEIICRVSVESRRHSLDSQVSVQIAEVTARTAAATPMPAASTATVSGGRGRKTRSRRQRREFGRIRSSRVGPLLIRRGSTTSQESQLGAQILSALTLANTTLPSLEANDVDLEDINDSDGEISDGMPAENDMKVVIASKFNEDENDDRNDDINNKRKTEVPKLMQTLPPIQVCHKEALITLMQVKRVLYQLHPYNQSNNEGREVGTQTTLSIDCIEMQELKGKNIIHPSPRACASQSTRVSPPSSRPSVPRSYSHGHFEKNQTSLVNKIADNVLSSPAGRALNYSYNVQRLVQELSEGSHAGPPVRPERRKSAQGKNSVRSKSADNKNVELQWNPVAL